MIEDFKSEIGVAHAHDQCRERDRASTSTWTEARFVLQRFVILLAAVAFGGCNDNDASQQAAQRASDIVKAQVAASGGLPGANVLLKDDAQGCKDKTKALDLIAAMKSGDTSKAIKLWAAGMKDQTCRGFAPGLPVKIDRKEGDLSCILPGDDPDNKQCLWIESKAL